MSDKIVYKFVDANETIESRGYKKAVKSFQNKFPKNIYSINEGDS